MSPQHDLLLKGGHVIDPRNGVDGVADVAIAGGKVAAVGPDLAATAGRAVDVSGLYVTPGLIDIHVHVFGGYAGWLFPDAHALPTGVTTVVDTGGAGWRDLDAFRQTIIEPATTRVLVFLNIVGAGMTGGPEQDVGEMDPRRCAEAVSAHPGLVVGTKSAHFGGPGWESAGGAIEAARLSNTIAMVDFAPQPTRSYAELLERMSPGDIHTHVYAAHIPLLDGERRVNGYVRAARERGIVFDTGHGGGSFWFRIAVPALQQGFPPDTISTDLHKASRVACDAVMPVTMAKFLAMGVPLSEVVCR
ncbi:MAG: amidohydrolase/deacetylase family metallohydrolase, partial [Candidatus Latescibacterota bacterium]